MFLSGSAIENCNRIYKLKNKEYEVVRVWKSSKEMGFSRSSQEDIVISRLQSLEDRDGRNLRKNKWEIKVNVDEDN